MKNLQLICLAATLVVSEAGYSHLALLRTLGDKDSGVSLLKFPSYEEKCSDNTIRECISCGAAKLCLPNGRPIAKVNCTINSPSTPFCNPEDGLCTSVEPSGCGETSNSAFYCPPQDGVYPDPQDCTKFHFCADGKATTVTCPKNNVYDHAQGTCKLRRWPMDCVKFNCIFKEGQDILYPKDDRIWATCAGGDAYIMGRCEDYESYDVNKKKCTRVCRTVENQPVSKDVCDSYIRCSDIGNGKFEPSVFPCPPGQGFDTESKQCSTKISCSKPTENEKDTETSEIINSGNDNSNNDKSNGDDEVNGNLVNGNDNSGNTDSGNVGSGNQRRFSSRIINHSGDNNNGNAIANGNDSVNGELINGNDNGNNENSGNVGSGNRARLSSRIINSSGNNNSNQTILNGNDSTNGSVINGNNNGNIANSGNFGSGNRGRISSRIINSSGNSNSDQTIVNGDDKTSGSVINGNSNNNNKNSNNVGTGNGHGNNEDSSSSTQSGQDQKESDADNSQGNDDSGGSHNSPNFIES